MSHKIILNSLALVFILMISIGGNSQELPVFTEKLRKGVYVTFEEFKFNNPSITDSLCFESEARTTKNWEDTFVVTARYVDNKKKVKKAWGFSDGEKAYCFHEFEFFEIDLSDNRLVFYGYGAVNESAVNTAAAVGGLIGGGFASAVAISNAKAKRIRYHINQANGNIDQLINVAYDEVTVQPDVYLVFYRYGKKEIPEAIQLTINDTLNIDLDPYSYDQIKFQVSRNPVKIDYGDGQTILYVDIKNEENKYVEASNTEAGKKEKLVLWDFVTGDFYAKKAKKRQLDREAKK